MENNKQTILFLINKLGVGGAERVFVNDANALLDQGLDIKFVTLFGSKSDQILLKDLRLPDKNIYHLEANKIYSPALYKKILNIIKTDRVKVLYSTLNESNIAARLIKIFAPSIKIFIREANVAGPKPILFKIFDILFNIGVNKIICVSQEVKNSLLHYMPFYKSKMVVLMNGVNMPSLSKDYSKKNSPIRILNVGSLTPKKGQIYLIEALSKVMESGIQFEARIFGKGKEEKSLLDKIEKLGLQDRVKILAPVPQAELSKEYIEADIFVLSSLWEGCPNVLLEAMAHGTASITTDVSGANDIVENGISGIVVNKGNYQEISNSIILLAENFNLRSDIALNGRKKIFEDFSMDAHINKLKVILKYGV